MHIHKAHRLTHLVVGGRARERIVETRDDQQDCDGPGDWDDLSAELQEARRIGELYQSHDGMPFRTYG